MRQRSIMGPLAAVVLLAATAQAGTIYVDADAPLGGDGLTWDTAYRYVQDALAQAAGDPSITEIRVGEGTYKPDQDEGGNVTPGAREATFQLIYGVALRGGFAGIGATDPDERDIELYETILSGDLLGDDGPDFANNDENSYHVVRATGLSSQTLVDGLTITAGNADCGPPDEDRRGAGIYVHGGGLTINGCSFVGNRSCSWGGAIYSIYSNADIVIVNSRFRDNKGGTGGGGYFDGGVVDITGCQFVGNDAPFSSHAGGALSFHLTVVASVKRCSFVDNRGDRGGGLFVGHGCTGEIESCLFNGNTALGEGGGVLVNSGGTASITNCTFAHNHAAERGGGLREGNWDGRITVANSIFWGNTSGDDITVEGQQISLFGDATLALDYTLVQGLCCIAGGTGNLLSDPLFVDPLGGDGVSGSEDDDLRLLPGSPAVNAGNRLTPSGGLDLDGHARVQQCRVDLGAYETPLFRDCNGNGISDACDIADGDSGDCNLAGVPDECKPDCDGDGIPDRCGLATAPFVAASGPLTPVLCCSPLSFTIEDPPIALSDVTLRFDVSADIGFGTYLHQIAIRVNGQLVSYIGFGGSLCADPPDQFEVVVPEVLFNDMRADGPVTIEMKPGYFIDVECSGGPFMTAAVEYLSFDPNEDSNGNGIPDECELEGPFVDIKPGSCPNSFNRNSNGVLPVALIGTADFDVGQVDLASIRLSRADGVGGAVAPHEGPPGPHTVMADVATPFPGEPCDCHELEGDGIDDLSMKFRSSDLVTALELDDLPACESVELELSGTLLDGTEFAVRDCIWLVPAGDIDCDGAVGASDLLAMLAEWGSCPAPPAECLADIDDDGHVQATDFLALLAAWGACPE